MTFSRRSAELAYWLAGGLGLGRVPRAPGTAAAAVATLVAAGLIAVSPAVLAAAAVLAIGAGLWAIPKVAPTGDPSWVVIDEVAGQWVALLGTVHLSIPALVAGFLLFRAFDILKPGPIHAAERLPGAIGVMADDLVAGVVVAIILVAGRLVFRGLAA